MLHLDNDAPYLTVREIQHVLYYCRILALLPDIAYQNSKPAAWLQSVKTPLQADKQESPEFFIVLTTAQIPRAAAV